MKKIPIILHSILLELPKWANLLPFDVIIEVSSTFNCLISLFAISTSDSRDWIWAACFFETRFKLINSIFSSSSFFNFVGDKFSFFVILFSSSDIWARCCFFTFSNSWRKSFEICIIRRFVRNYNLDLDSFLPLHWVSVFRKMIVSSELVDLRNTTCKKSVHNIDTKSKANLDLDSSVPLHWVSVFRKMIVSSELVDLRAKNRYIISPRKAKLNLGQLFCTSWRMLSSW